MSRTPKQAVLNRPVFTQQAFDSSSLSVLVTLIHRFPKAGYHEVFVHRGGSLVRRFAVDVRKEAVDRQINVDMATLDDDERGCGCDAKNGYTLSVDGMIGFYASKGTGRFTVTIQEFDDKAEKKVTVLENAKAVPAGDLFAVTLVRPGIYRARDEASKTDVEIRVTVPKAGNYQPDQATLVPLGKEGGYGEKLEIASGQSLVFQPEVDSTIRVELVKPDEAAGDPISDKRFSFKKPKPPKKKG